MSFTRVKLVKIVKHTHFINTEVRLVDELIPDPDKIYSLVGGKPDVLFFIDIKQPTAPTMVLEFETPFQTIPSDAADFEFFLVEIHSRG